MNKHMLSHFTVLADNEMEKLLPRATRRRIIKSAIEKATEWLCERIEDCDAAYERGYEQGYAAGWQACDNEAEISASATASQSAAEAREEIQHLGTCDDYWTRVEVTIKSVCEKAYALGMNKALNERELLERARLK